jgi:hypothetical protein
MSGGILRKTTSGRNDNDKVNFGRGARFGRYRGICDGAEEACEAGSQSGGSGANALYFARLPAGAGGVSHRGESLHGHVGHE